MFERINPLVKTIKPLRTLTTTGTRRVENVRNFLEVKGIDLNSDGDTGDVIPLTFGLLTEEATQEEKDFDGTRTRYSQLGCV